MVSSFEQFRAEKTALVEENIVRFLPDDTPPLLSRAMRYSLESGGKRLRPLLFLAAAECFGCNEQSLLKPACSFELVHTYSLIHDDLPAMDDSDLRRGRASLHRAFDEAAAILAGDALLTHAFQLIAEYGIENRCSDRAILITRELSSAAGPAGMVGGQVLDLAAEGRAIKLPELNQLASMKTGALIMAAVRSGAIAAGAAGQNLERCSVYAGAVGRAFQVADDLLDRTGQEEDLGKPVGTDQARGKCTYPVLLGIDGSRALLDELYSEARSALQMIEGETSYLEALARILIFRNS